MTNQREIKIRWNLFQMELRGSTAGRIVRSKWNSYNEIVEVPSLYRSSTASSQVDKEKGREEEFEDSVLL